MRLLCYLTLIIPAFIIADNTMFPELFIKLSVAVLFGAIIGFEREYRSKAAGFRTITLITLGSTLFTIISCKLGTNLSPDRIASNIITGIGFIGAGVVFKDGFAISGLTTAATIWVSAAIGMALGIGEYLIAGCTLLLAIIVLALFEKVQDLIDDFHQVRMYRINFGFDYAETKRSVEKELNDLKISFRIKKIFRTEEEITFLYETSGSQKILERFSQFLITFREVKSFDK